MFKSIQNLFKNSHKKSDILKMKGKLKIIRDNIVDEYVTHSMTRRIINALQ